MRCARLTWLCIVPTLGLAGDDCSAELGANFGPSEGIFEAISEQELESAEADEAEMMQMALLQTAKVQQRGTADSQGAGTAPGVLPAHEPEELADAGSLLHQSAASQVGKGAAGAVAVFSVLSDATEQTGREDSSHQKAAPQTGKGSSHVAGTARGPSEHGSSFVAPASSVMLAHRASTEHFFQASFVLLFVVAMVAQALMSTTRFSSKHTSSTRWTLPSLESDLAIRSYTQDLQVSPATSLETVYPDGGGSSGAGVFTEPETSAAPVRVEVCIEGLLDRSTMLSPFSQQSCVMYSAAATPSGEQTPLACSSKSADFIVSMADAPWVKILVEGADVLCFGMKSGLWQQHQTSFELAPPHLKEFVASRVAACKSVSKAGSETPVSEKTPLQASRKESRSIDFEETALVVGSSVTLVGKLCRGPGGQLSLQRWQAHVCQFPETSPKSSCITSEAGNYDNAVSQDEWTGKILACDDPSLSCSQ